MKLLLLILLFPLLSFGALRNQQGTKHADAQALLNKGAGTSTAAKVRLGNVLKEQLGVAIGNYSFAVQGGAVGAISLRDADGQPLKLPTNALIKNVIINVITTPTSGGAATISVGIVSANDLLLATAVASVAGNLQGIPDDATVADFIKLSSEQTVDITVAVAALTAGKFNVLIEYVVSE
jgi:hypothetical protein